METQNEQKQASENISKIFNFAGTPAGKVAAQKEAYQKQQKEILRSVFG